jgi:hypothetical protein
MDGWMMWVICENFNWWHQMWKSQNGWILFVELCLYGSWWMNVLVVLWEVGDGWNVVQLMKIFMVYEWMDQGMDK